jgi:hypothetical protein
MIYIQNLISFFFVKKCLNLNDITSKNNDMLMILVSKIMISSCVLISKQKLTIDSFFLM